VAYKLLPLECEFLIHMCFDGWLARCTLRDRRNHGYAYSPRFDGVQNAEVFPTHAAQNQNWNANHSCKRTVQPLKDCSRGALRLGCGFRANLNLRPAFFSILRGYYGNLRP